MAQIIAGITGVATVGGIGINIYQVYKQKQDDKIKRVVEIERIDGKFNEIKTLLQASNMVNRAETRQMISEHSSDEKLFNIGIGLGTVVGSGVIAALINKYLS
jgi:cell division protein YceG involved in septum cleavage